MKWLAGVVPLVVLAACYSDAQPVAKGASEGEVTFVRDVAPILRARCQGCHAPGGIAPFPLVTYRDAAPMAARIAAATASGLMPPWGAKTTDECKPKHPFKDDPRLSEGQVALLRRWAETGTKEGTGVLPAAVPPAVGLEGALSLAPKAPHALDLTKERDELRCFVLDPGITENRYLTGVHFVPGNASVVHHALAFAIAETDAVPADEYECFGGPRVNGASLVAAWAPGALPIEYPAGVALPLAKGTRFIMQVHYHPHANASPAPDATAFQVRLSDTPPAYVVVSRLIGNFEKPVGDIGGGLVGGLMSGPNDPPTAPEFLIPAEAKGHTETMSFRVPEKVRGLDVGELGVLNVGAHMHYVGVDERVSVKRVSPAAGEEVDECLLHVPKWDFDWQRGYQYDAPLDLLPKVRPGDELLVRCTYDNTLGNPKLVRGLREQSLTVPQAVRLGESTLDEMCLAAFVFVRKL